MNTEKAIFASGCFWGTEYYFQKAKGVIETTVGYIGGHVDNPTYKQVCTGKTGHAEAIEITYDPAETSYKDMVKLFFETHDQSHVNRQGPDIGHQYRSGIFYLNDEQRKIAEETIADLKQNNYKVATEVTEATTFYSAEDYHQEYYTKGGGSPYCHFYTKKF